MKKLHSTQSRLLKLLKKHINNPLTIRDLAEKLDDESPGVIHHHLVQLEKKGYLKRNPHNPRDYVVLDSPEDKIVYISKYGTATCGPDGFLLDGNVIETIPIASNLLKFPAAEAFIVEAKGNSMEKRIYNGDIIIARRQNYAGQGDIIVCAHNGEVKIKQLMRTGEDLFLCSLNSQEYPPVRVIADELKIEGIVKNILHYG